jgi:hypothetical protein
MNLRCAQSFCAMAVASEKAQADRGQSEQQNFASPAKFEF